MREELDDAVRPFVDAVVAQVARPLGVRDVPASAEARVRAVVANLIARASDPTPAARVPAELLVADLVLLAAFFQNVDLLYDGGYAHADAVSMLVMHALELLDRTG
ncbi:MAG TPA: hypothetical protein VFE05_18095 [Longimicrobiaceae bacterium]|jgi:hypothetical protein|nr:hypothetical protein [Longimicrobiaceae bacterium]